MNGSCVRAVAGGGESPARIDNLRGATASLCGVAVGASLQNVPGGVIEKVMALLLERWRRDRRGSLPVALQQPAAAHRQFGAVRLQAFQEGVVAGVRRQLVA